MDKRYQVFVSSTYEDLQEERKEVMQALLELDCIPAGMELFPASNDDQWTLIKRVIDDCDYYLLIIGGKYGSVNEKGISYTQMEFEYALETGKPIISFLHKNPGKIPLEKSEQSPERKEKLEQFKNIAKKKLIKYWDTPENLGSVVSRSMVRLIKDFPAEGWVKSNTAVDETAIQEISRLQKENFVLKSKMEAMATEAPAGTEKFSQGEDKIGVRFSFKGVDNKTAVRYECTYAFDYTWNELFERIAPHMIDECTEYLFRDSLCRLLEENQDTLYEEHDFKNLRSLSEFRISDDSFALIKIQFRALGLICLSNRKRSAKDINTYWTLTPYGDFLITQLLAIKK